MDDPQVSKKDTSRILSEDYSSEFVEAEWYDWWKQAGFFKPEYTRDENAGAGNENVGASIQRDNTVVLITTPPNVTGTLHLGHALTIALQDSFTRWHRMRGKTTLWVPGLDHAGLTAQMVVERKLSRKLRKPLYELDQEEVLEEIKEMMGVQSLRIKRQLKQLGGSYDWDRYSFTLHEKPSRAVTAAFCQLYDEGLIYRCKGLVHWSCYLRTALSYREIDMKEIYSGQSFCPPGYDRQIMFGEEISFPYKVIEPEPDGIKEVIVSTTRIEWMLGHLAVVIDSSNEDIVKKLEGKSVKHPFFERELPIIVDDQFIRKRKDCGGFQEEVHKEKKIIPAQNKYSTNGARGVVPAHDFASYELWKKHKNFTDDDIEVFQVIDDEGLITDQCGEAFRRMKRFEVRNVIIAKLEDLVNVQRRPVHTTIQICSSSLDIIELQYKPQWFLNTNGDPHDALFEDQDSHNTGAHDMKVKFRQSQGQGQSSQMNLHEQREDSVSGRQIKETMVAEALTCLEQNIKDLHIKPGRFLVDCTTTLSNAKRWCISRQGKWGHNIPAYFATGNVKKKTCWVAGSTRESAREKAAAKLEEEDDNVRLEQEKGVLDAWFSSSLLPFSIFGWPDKTSELKKFYPGTILETGDDIFKLWVSRMIMMGVKLMKELPFKEIYMHKMIRDANGIKMSKGHGNIIDPSDIISGINGQDLEKKMIESYSDINELERALEEKRKHYPDGFERFGADSLRLCLISYVQPDEKINFDIKDIKECKNFCQMIWTAFRKAQSLFQMFPPGSNTEQLCESRDTRGSWMAYLVSITVCKVNKGFESFDFKNAVQMLKQFWDDLCIWYIDQINQRIDQDNSGITLERVQILNMCLDQGLRLLHPFMPFITEELFQRLPGRSTADPSICVMRYPDGSQTRNRHFDILKEYLKEIRNIGVSNCDVELLLPRGTNLSSEMQDCYREIICHRLKARTDVRFSQSEDEKQHFRLTIQLQ